MPASSRQLNAESAAARRPPAPPPRFLHCIEVTERWATYALEPYMERANGIELPEGARLVSIQPARRIISATDDGVPVQVDLVTRWLAFFVIEEAEHG